MQSETKPVQGALKTKRKDNTVEVDLTVGSKRPKQELLPSVARLALKVRPSLDHTYKESNAARISMLGRSC